MKQVSISYSDLEYYYREGYFFFQAQRREDPTQVSLSNFADDLIYNRSALPWLKKTIDEFSENFEDGQKWKIDTDLKAYVASKAMLSKQPLCLLLVAYDDEYTNLDPSLVSAMLDNAREITEVHLHCLNSFYRAECTELCKQLFLLCVGHVK